MSVKSITECAMEQGNGILHMAPTWVPRTFCIPGRRLKLHPSDYYALGGQRGGIDERWFSSTTNADNGPATPEDEGLSYIIYEDGSKTEKVLFRDAIDELKGQIIGSRIWDEYRQWPMFSKFFDNKGALPFHIHQRDHHVTWENRLGKPEAYYFPAQLNNYGADFPYTFFGFKPGTTKDQVREALVNFTRGDNRITDLSVAHRLEPGTGWDIPAGILHAPGSVCTYEPQKASDVLAMFQSVVGDMVISQDLLWANTPPDRRGDFDYLVEIIDWEANTDPEFSHHHFMEPAAVMPVEQMAAEGYQENWICYKSTVFSAKELTVFPGKTVTVRDSAAYGLIAVQGHGTLGDWDIETPALIRYGQITMDEFFVTEAAAKAGVVIQNPSKADPLVILKHFGPGNPDLHIE